jgi:uncharacterized protein (DUF4213/DUF364 family)
VLHTSQSIFFSKLMTSLPDGLVRQVCVGMIWTVVVVEVEGKLQGGIAATLQNREYGHTRLPTVNAAGRLEEFSSHALASLIQSQSHTEAAVGLAAINALLPRRPELYQDLDAASYLAQHGSGKNLAVIGHFPFVEHLRGQVRTLWVLELEPRPGDLPAEEAPLILPQADIVAITATTLINRTLDGLLAVCRPDARVMLLGPSTPLTPLIFEDSVLRVDVLSGSLVEDPAGAARVVAQGGTSRQLKGMLRQVSLFRH